MNFEKISLKKVKQQIDELVIDPLIKQSLRFLFICLGLSFLWLAAWWNRLPPEIPLIYSHTYGPDRLIKNGQLWFLPSTALIINLITIKAAGYFMTKDRLLVQMLIFSCAIATLIILVALIKSVLLVV